jgi:hypothetical protein
VFTIAIVNGQRSAFPTGRIDRRLSHAGNEWPSGGSSRRSTDRDVGEGSRQSHRIEPLVIIQERGVHDRSRVRCPNLI